MDDAGAKPWFSDAFGALYPLLYAHRSVARARPEALFAAYALRLTPRDALLDLCCGTGRHLVHLIPLAGLSIGLDFSPDLLALAQGQIPDRKLVRADMRRVPFECAFDVVTNFFTSFGYFEDDDNLRAARAIASALKPGGRFLIDHMNAATVERDLLRRNVRTARGLEIHERRWIDSATRRVCKETRAFRDGVAVYRATESVRLYAEAELRALLAQAGLVVEQVFGDFEGRPFNASAARMIMMGRKA